MSDWDHRDLWRRRGHGFEVEVSRHSVVIDSSIFHSREGPHRWCIYAYISSKHPHFKNFSGPDMWQDASKEMPLHAGVSYFRYRHTDAGVVTSVQVGCDYNHLHDDEYTHYATKDDASSVFHDAEELFDWLQARQKEKSK